MSASDPWKSQLEVLGAFIRTQRQLAKLSLREMAELTLVSNPYLSQVERGLHEPSLRVLKAIARALNLSAETILAQAGLLGEDDEPGETTSVVEAAIATDPVLSREQKEALLGVYRSYVARQRSTDGPAPSPASAEAAAPRSRPSRKGVTSSPPARRSGGSRPTPPNGNGPEAPTQSGDPGRS